MDWIALSAVSGAVVAGGTVSVFVFRHLHPKIVAARQFWGALVGIEENVVTGQKRCPGLFERIDSLERRIEERLDQQDEALSKQDVTLARQDSVLETIRHEVQYNSGGSVKDAVRRIESQLKEQGQK